MMKIDLFGIGLVEVDESKAVDVGGGVVEVPVKDGTYGENNRLEGVIARIPRSMLKPAVIQ